MSHSDTLQHSGSRVRRRVHLLEPLDRLFTEHIKPRGYADLTDYLHANIRRDVGLLSAQNGPQ